MFDVELLPSDQSSVFNVTGDDDVTVLTSHTAAVVHNTNNTNNTEPGGWWLVATATSHCITVTTPTNINSKRLGDYQLFFEGKCQLNLKICCHQSKTKNF